MSVRSTRRSFPATTNLNTAHRAATLRPALLAAAAVVACSATGAMAQMTLTQAGIDRGFELTTFAHSFPTAFGIGPRGVHYEADGHVLVSSLNGQVRRFESQTDGQSALSVAPFVTFGGTDNANGMGRIGTDPNIYLAQHNNNRVIRMNPDGTNQVTIATVPSALDIAVHPTTNELFVTGSAGGSGGVFRVNPVTGAVVTLSPPGERADGITITRDGSQINVANFGGTSPSRIVGYDTASGLEFFRSAQIPGDIDGLALGFGPLTGNIYTVTNDGRFWEMNLATQNLTLIGTGGSRGDLMTSDPSGSGDVLFSQANSVLRLRGVPTPSTAALLGLGGLMAARRRRALA